MAAKGDRLKIREFRNPRVQGLELVAAGDGNMGRGTSNIGSFNSPNTVAQRAKTAR